MSNRLAQIKNVYDTANPNINKGTKSEDTLTNGIKDDSPFKNRAVYLYNKVLDGLGSVASGLGDVGVQFTNKIYGIDNGNEVLKAYREQYAPGQRKVFTDQLGGELDKKLENKYNNETITGALGGLAQSVPAIGLTMGSGGLGTGAMFLQSYDNALESINQTEAGRSLDEGTKTFFAGGVGIVTSALEKYGLDKIFKGETGIVSNAIARKAIKEATEESGGKVTGDLFTKFLDKEILNLTNRYVKGGAKALDGALIEYSTEALQEGAQAGAELLINKTTGKPVFDTTETGTWDGFLRRMNRAGIAGAIGGGLLGSVAALGGVKSTDIENNTNQLNEVNTALENEQLSDASREVLVQEKIKLQDDIQKSADKIDEAYAKLDNKQKERVNEIVEEKAKLQEVLADENIPESIKENITKQDEDLTKELSEIKPVEEPKSTETTETPSTSKESTVQHLNTQESVSRVYESDNKIKEVGTEEEFKAYSDSIFPESKIKDVVYHGTNNSFETFEKGYSDMKNGKTDTYGIHFIEEAAKDTYGKNYGKMIAAKLDFKNPLITEYSTEDGSISKRLEYLSETDMAEFKKQGYDSGIIKRDGETEYIAFEPEQIINLSDAQRFKSWKQYNNKSDIKIGGDSHKYIGENIDGDLLYENDKGERARQVAKFSDVYNREIYSNKKERDYQFKTKEEYDPNKEPRVSSPMPDKFTFTSEEGKKIEFKADDIKIRPGENIDLEKERKFNHFDVVVGNEIIAEFGLRKRGNYLVSSHSEIHGDNWGKGIGKAAYIKLGEYINSIGKKLRSSSAENRNEMSDGTWRSLEKDGLAEKVVTNSDNYYVFNNESLNKKNEQGSSNSNNTQEAQKPKETTTEARKESVTGITQEATAKARKAMGIEAYEKTSQSNEQRRAKAEKAIKDGYNVKQLIQNIKNSEDFVPSRQEMEILKIYENSLDAAINKNPTTELLAERADLLRTVDIGTSRAGAALQAVAGVEASVDNLANFLQAEAVHYGVDELPQNIIDDLKGKYEKGQEAKRAYEEGYQKAKDELIKQQAEAELAKQRKKSKSSVKKSSADYASERAELKQSIKDKLKKARGQLNAVPVPYLNELIAIAPDVAKLVRSYVEEGVSKLDDIVKKVHSDLKDDIDGITEQDVIDLISGQYNPKRPTKTEILSQVRDLREQAKLLKKIDDLENGKVPNDPVKQVRRNAELEALRKQVKELEDEVGITEQRTLKSRRTALDNKIKQLQDDLETGNFDLEPAEPRRVRLDAETQKKQDEYIAFLKETNRRRDQAVYNQQSKITKAWLKFQQILGLRRLIQTSIDFSMPFRQAVTVTLNPRYFRTTLQSFGNMFKSTVSEKKYDRIMFAIQQDPLYNDMRADGLMFSEVDSKDNLKREENYRTSFLYKIPYLREPFLASNRAAAAYINTARYNLYLKGVERLRAQGITPENSPENYAALAKWTMNMTGRGNLLDFMEKGENASKWQRIMGDTFYGTRLMASRFNMLNPNYYIKMPKEQRIEALKDIGSYVALSGMVALGAIGAGAKVSLDPEDADFLKAKWGDKRYDIFSGGMNTYLRTAYRLMKAILQRTNPKLYGENKDRAALKKANKYGSFAVKSGTDFFRYKLAPNTSYVLSGTLGKDPLGRDFDPKDILRFYPMYVDDLKDAMKKDNAALESLSILAPSLFGIGVQEYSNKENPTKEKE